MDEIKIDAATLEEAGAAIGFMFAAFLRGFKEGVDAYDVMEAANDIKEVHETEEPLKRDPVKPKSGIAGSAGAINARGWRNARKSAKDTRRTGYALSRASVARTECASSLARKQNAKISCRAKGLTTDRQKKNRPVWAYRTVIPR